MTNHIKPRLLIIDDLSVNLKVQALLFSQHNYEVLVANNARQALLLAEEKQPNIILSDIMMPETDGIELCRRLKQNTLTKHIPVFFLSADTTEETIKRAFEAGGCDYLSKPYNESEILLKIKRHLGTGFNLPIALPVKSTIAIADDNPLNRHILNDFLKTGGYIPHVFDGATSLITTGNLEQFDAILLDIEMPLLNGWDALKIIRAKNFSKPVIAISAHCDTTFIDKCLNHGFNDVICKPLFKKDLLNTIVKQLNYANRQPEINPAGSNNDEVIDLTGILNITKTDRAYRITAYNEFIDLVKKIISSVENSIEKSKMDETLLNDVHSFKNVARYFCNKTIVDQIKTIMQELKTKSNFENTEATRLLILMQKILTLLKNNLSNI